MAKTLVAGIGGVVLGLAAGIVLGMTIAEPQTAPPPPADGSSADSGAEPDVARRVTDDAPREGSERRHVTGQPVAVEQFLSTIDLGPLPTGDGTISGRVVTDEGEPLAGVEVTATPSEPAEWDEEEVEDDSAAAVAHYARSVHWREKTIVRVESASDGTFELTGLASRGHRVQARHDAYRLRREGRGRVQPGETVDFVATPLTKATFVVRDPEGRAVENAMIAMEGTGGSRNMSWRGERSQMTVAPGTYRVSAKGGEFGEMTSASVTTTFEKGRVDHLVELDLREVPGIGGSIRAEAGATVSFVQVWMVRCPDGSEPSPARITQTGKSAHVSTIHGEPRYIFTELPPGKYAVAACRMNEFPRDIEMLEVTEGFVRHDIVVPDYRREECLEIVAFGPDGKPVSKVYAMIQRTTDDGGSMADGVQPVKRSDGVFWAPIPANYDRSSGTFTVEVTHGEYGSQRQEFAPGPGARVEIRFEEPARATIEVVGYAGSGAEGRITVAVVGERGMSWRPGDSLDAEGKMDVGPLAPGNHALAIVISDRMGGGRELARRDVALVSGDNDVSLGLPNLHTLTVELSGEVGQRRVGLTVGEAGRGWTTLGTPDENGRTVFDLLPPGEYTVVEFGGTGERKTITVPQTTTVRF